MAAGTQGTISQVIGSTFDAQFPEDSLPEIYNALEITWNQDGQDMKLVGEVQQHLGGGRVRAVALGSTDGLKRGMPIADTGAPVAVPFLTDLNRFFFFIFTHFSIKRILQKSRNHYVFFVKSRYFFL